MFQQIINLIQNNHLSEAKELCNQLRLKNKKNPDIFLTLADIDNRLGNIKSAIKFYRKAIQLKPDYILAHTQIGILFHSQNKLTHAESSYRQSLMLGNKQPFVYFNLGAILQEKGQLDEAAKLYHQAIELKPDYAKAYVNLGYIYRKQDKLEDATSNYRKALQYAPNIAEIHYNLGINLLRQGYADDAESHQRRALELNPNYTDAWSALGMVQFSCGQLEDAGISYKKALSINPEHAEALRGYAAILSMLKIFDDSIEFFKKSLLINPGNENAMIGLATAYLGANDHKMALSVYKQLIVQNPDLAEPHIGVASVYKAQGKYEDAINSYRNALEIQPEHHTAYSDLVMLMNYSDRFTPSCIYNEHVNWARKYSLKISKLKYENISDPDRRVRVAYLSPDLRKHVVVNFFYPILKHHNTDHFEIYCYAEVAQEDPWSQLLKAETSHWINTYSKSDAQLIDQIRADKIDILIDLAGHTKGNRLLALTARPAPIQMTYLGYPNTTGLSTVDYRLTDKWADPEGDSDNFHTENLIRLSNGFLCYLPMNEMPNISTLPAVENGYITFGSFNNLTKITASVVKLWARILNKSPDAKLVIKNRSLNAPQVRERYLALFKSHGIEDSRIQLFSATKSYDDHLNTYNQIDIALDTFPYNGTTTTCEALMMGVPVITLAGNMHAGRVGISILSQIKLTDYISQTPDEYIQLALKKASDIEELSKLRNTLRNQFLTSSLADGQQFTQDIEQSYRHIWKNWCDAQVI